MATRKKAHVVSVSDSDWRENGGYSADFLMTALESSFDGIYITDGDANTIMANQSYESISGLDRREILGQNMHDLVENRVISQSGTLAALETGQPVTMEQVFKTGKRAIITSTPIYNEQDEIVMVLTNVRDVTEMRDLEQKLENTTAQNQIYTTELKSLRQQYTINLRASTRSAGMQKVINNARLAAKSDMPVLLRGERGVGKEGIARFIAGKSNRKDAPFVAVNCLSAPEELEADLFGSPNEPERRGGSAERGLLELAQGGTVLLDEVGALPLHLQVRVALFILRQANMEPQDKVRIMATSSSDLHSLTERRRFSEDLYYLLSSLVIDVPPLRERREDILGLVESMAAELNRRQHRKKRFSHEAKLKLYSYDWPGNLWEMRNVISQLFTLDTGTVIGPEDLPFQCLADQRPDRQLHPLEEPVDLQKLLDEMELSYIRQAYEKGGNVRRAAQMLGMEPSTFVRRRKKLEDACCKNATSCNSATEEQKIHKS